MSEEAPGVAMMCVVGLVDRIVDGFSACVLYAGSYLARREVPYSQAWMQLGTRSRMEKKDKTQREKNVAKYGESGKTG